MPTEKFFNLKEGKRQAILEAAGEELLETPYSLLTVSQIIQRAGISRASFYYYFNDKEDLFQHMVEEMKTRFLKDMEKTLRECGEILPKGLKKWFLPCWRMKIWEKGAACTGDWWRSIISSRRCVPEAMSF